jgi:hypothetical protein
LVIIGAQRSGTTVLYDALRAHPDVVGGRAKESHLLDLWAHRGERGYRAWYPMQRSAAVAIDATPYYLAHPAVPRRAAEMLPSARFVAVLRHPVDRAWSHWRLATERGHEWLPFLDALEAEPARLAGEAERLARGDDHPDRPHQTFGYAMRGRYAEQLDRWVDAVGSDRLLVLRTTDLRHRPGEMLAGVIAHAGLTLVDLPWPTSARSGRAPLDDSEAARAVTYVEDDLADLRSRYAIELERDS